MPHALSVEERVVPSCIIVDIRVVVIRRVIEKVVTAGPTSSRHAAAVEAAAVVLGGRGVVSVGHRGAAVELRVAVIAAAAMGVAIMMVMMLVRDTAAPAALTLVATGYDVAHADAAPR